MKVKCRLLCGGGGSKLHFAGSSGAHLSQYSAQRAQCSGQR
ncbi:DNA replication licensing factor MCM6 [Frankliniella fusca]|uniref:DNA replication licensing factor MCM6 n=1 Tax=Frankliniella fusca TaxID=407009 RepID=A0AAE1GW45_9NEOP|nr:DNA replication licensing factor MCM6 [Frankliniella fusca]